MTFRTNGVNNQFAILSNGNVLVENGNLGVGTTSPSGKLDITTTLNINGSGINVDGNHTAGVTCFFKNAGALTASGDRSVLNVQATNASATAPALILEHVGTGPNQKFVQTQDVEVMDFDNCSDGGTGRTTIAGSLKVQMPNGATGYINFYT